MDLAIEALIRRLSLTLARQEAAVVQTRAQLDAALEMRDRQSEMYPGQKGVPLAPGKPTK